MPDNIADIAQRHGFSPDAARVVAEALRHGGGRMAQFSHPELGGMGQWSAGGMVMIGDMFNNALKARVDALCRELAAAPGPVPAASGDPASVAPASGDPASRPPASAIHSATQGRPAGEWWPDGLGQASATGAQNDMRYACFPSQRRLAILRDGQVRVYDTGDHRISGFSQQQGGSQSLTFTSQDGLVRVEDLKQIRPA